MTAKTLHASHAPLERHLQLVESSKRLSLSPTFTLSAVDCFAINRLLDSFPNKTTLIDCAAQATAGASSIVLLQHENVEQVIAASLDPNKAIDRSLTTVLQHSAGLEQNNSRLLILEEPLHETAAWDQLLLDIPPLSPIVFLLNPAETTEQFLAQFRFVLALHGSPAIFLTPVGFLGEQTTLQQIVLECRGERQRQVSLLREVSPFLGESQLAVLCQENDRYIFEMLRRTAQLFKGNFDFLALLDDKLSADQKIQELERKVQDLETMIHLQPAAAVPDQQQESEPAPPAQIPPIEIQQADAPTKLKYLYRKVVPQRIRSIIYNLRQQYAGR